MLSNILPESIKSIPNKFPLLVHESQEANKATIVGQTLFIAPFLSEELKYSREWQSLKYQFYLKFHPVENVKLEIANSNLMSPIGKLPFLLSNKGDPKIFEELDLSLNFKKDLDLDDVSLLYLIEQKLGLGLDYFIITDGYESILKSNWFKDSNFPLNHTLSKKYQLDTLQSIGEKLNNLSHEDILTDIEQILLLLNEKLNIGEKKLFSNESLPNSLDITLFSIFYLINNLFNSNHQLVKLAGRFDSLNKFYDGVLDRINN